MACACRLSRSRPGPVFTEFHSLTWLFHIEYPSWCSATGPANLAPACLKSDAHALGSQLPPADTSLGWNLVNWPALLLAPR